MSDRFLALMLLVVVISVLFVILFAWIDRLEDDDK